MHHSIDEKAAELKAAYEADPLMTRALMDQLPYMISIKNIEGTLIYGNKAFYDLYTNATSKEEIEFVAQGLTPMEQMILKSDGGRYFEASLVDPMGMTVWIESFKCPVKNELGEIISIFTISKNITKRKLVETELRESELRLSLATSGGKIGLWDWNIPTGRALFNESWANIIGCTLEELEPVSIQTWLEWAHPEDLERSNVMLEKCFKRETDHYEIEARMRHKNGSWVWVLDRGQVIEWDENQNPIRMVGTHIDITDRKRTEQELSSKERILSAVALSIKELIDNRDYLEAISRCFEILGEATQVDRVYLFINQEDETGQKTTSQKIEWNSGHSMPQIDNPELQNIPFEAIGSFIAPLIEGNAYYGIVADIEDEAIRDLLSEQKILSIVVLPIIVRDTFWGFVGFDECKVARAWSEAEFSTLSAFAHSLEKTVERSLIEKELEISRVNAESANALKSQFLANMSHEIRTPMNAILGYTAMLKDMISGEKAQAYLNSVENAGSTLVNLINDILDISKIEAGKMELTIEPVNIRDLFSEIGEVFSLTILEKALDFVLEIHPKVPTILMLDEVRTRQILFNLVGNAVKFTDCGEVVIRASVEVEQAVDNQVTFNFEVCDTGIGISSDQQATLFEPFKQTDGQSTKRYGGSGLGLSISKRLVEMMGGCISLESELEAGTCFTVSIPSVKIGDYGDLMESSEVTTLHRLDLREKEKVPGLAGASPHTSQKHLIPEGVSEACRNELDALYEGLWVQCAKTYKAADLRRLSSELEVIGNRYQNEELVSFAKVLLEAINTFNSKKTRELLKVFSNNMETLTK